MENIENIKILPMIALRGLVVLPGVAETVDVGRKASLAALEFAAESHSELFVAAQKDQQIVVPMHDDIYEVGTVVKI